MTTIRLETYVEAGTGVCFDLSRSVDTHVKSMANKGERAVAGTLSGLMELNDTVTWEGTHFGVRMRMTSRVTDFESPNRFADEMIQGPFKRLKHVHEFLPKGIGTLMVDTFEFESRFSIIGRLLDTLVLARYLRGLLVRRNEFIRSVAEKSRQS